MLALTRKAGEKIHILLEDDRVIIVEVNRISRSKAKILVDAPPTIRVTRPDYQLRAAHTQ